MEGRCGLGAEQEVGGLCRWEGRRGVEYLSALEIRTLVLGDSIVCSFLDKANVLSKFCRFIRPNSDSQSQSWGASVLCWSDHTANKM